MTRPQQGDSEARPSYFRQFESIRPAYREKFSEGRQAVWQILAVISIGLGAWYLYWRWLYTLNTEAIAFSVVVVSTETVMFLGSMIFYYDIWAECDTPVKATEHFDCENHKSQSQKERSVDIFIATYDEDINVLSATLTDAQKVHVPLGWQVQIFLLDDGARDWVRILAEQFGVKYLARSSNRGFKAGNLKNALLQSDGCFILICDADTRLFPSFLENTLGYFSDPKVAWVQTPHWFYEIPLGRKWTDILPACLKWFSGPLTWVTGKTTIGRDPFLSGSDLFFDVIQRRRNRHGASFCCGAGSIHRREPLLKNALAQHKIDRSGPVAKHAGTMAAQVAPVQPFRFHVSEDIYTSMKLHGSGGGWTSVYHPQVESRMLSPWSMEAWASQKLKYAGGTLDIMLHDNPLFRRGMPWRTKLHYAATFWSYLSSVALLVLLCAPVLTLITGVAPVEAYSISFFLHLLPFLLANELALAVGINGHDGNQGRILAVGTLPITLRALWLVLLGKKIGFKPTPKTPILSRSIRYVLPHIAGLLIMLFAATYGIWQWSVGSEDHGGSLMIVNLFWMAWNASALGRPILSALWTPPAQTKDLNLLKEVSDGHVA